MSGHRGTFFTVDRTARPWVAQCECGMAMSDDRYEGVEDQWRQHVHAHTGRAPVPFGDKADRWSA